MSDPFLEVVDLQKRFGGVIAVDSLSFKARKGNITSIIGPNGAGKTTIFNMIAGSFSPTAGEIRYQGVPITGKPPHSIAGLGIARTFQHIQVFSEMTVLENVMVGRHTRSAGGMLISLFTPPVMRKQETRIREDAGKWLDFVEMAAHAGMPAGNLPLGNQRMLEIARALAMEPGLLLLDEPASGLNSRETIRMGALIRKIREIGITVVLVEHDMELVMEISDHVIVINFGRCIGAGTPGEVQSHPEVIAAYLGE